MIGFFMPNNMLPILYKSQKIELLKQCDSIHQDTDYFPLSKSSSWCYIFIHLLFE